MNISIDRILSCYVFLSWKRQSPNCAITPAKFYMKMFMRFGHQFMDTYFTFNLPATAIDDDLGNDSFAVRGKTDSLQEVLCQIKRGLLVDFMINAHT